jgi:hypothetical protein
MQIQRIQTLYILLAIAAVVAFIFIPFGFWDATVQASGVKLVELNGKMTALLIPACVAILVMFISIFSYKKFPLQKGLVGLSMLIVVAMMLLVIYVMTMGFDVLVPDVTVKPIWAGGGLLLVAALVALIAALSRIKADQKLLRSYDRLR